jgi:hypothetical protein
MKRIKVLLDFIELSVAGKIVFFRNVLAKMKASAGIFTNPDESLETAGTSVDTLEANSIAAAGGGRAATAAMHASEDDADEIFRILAAYVDRMAKGDESIILLSGFNTSKQPTPAQKADLTVVSGSNSGSVKLTAKALKGAGSYIWQMAKGAIPTDESGWTTIGFTTQASNDVTGLDVATKYYFRVAVVTNTGTTDFTAAVMKVVE